VGDEFRANDDQLVFDQQEPSVMATADGGFVVSWQSYGEDGGVRGIYAQRYDANGSTEHYDLAVSATNVTEGLTDSIVGVEMLSGATVAVQQVDLIELVGDVEMGDSYTVTVNGEAVSYTAQAGDTLSSIRAGLVGAINANSKLNALVTAQSATASPSIILTGVSAGMALTTAIIAANAGIYDNNGGTVRTLSQPEADARQVSLLTVQGTPEIGDIYAVTVGMTTYSHTVASGDGIVDVRDALLGQMGALAGATATAGTQDGEITLRATQIGVGFQASDASQNVAISGTDNNAATLTQVHASDDLVGATIDGGAGDDTLYGSIGDDTLIGGAGDDTLYGGDGNDTLIGGEGADTIHAGEGDDLVQYTSGADVIDGGSGYDAVTFEFVSDDNVIIDLANETFGVGNYTSSIKNTEAVYGSDQNDQLAGDDAANILSGGLGDDTLYGAAGADHLYGGSGSDLFIYTSASDTGLGDGSRDKIFDFDAGTSTSSVDKLDLTGLIDSDFSFVGLGDFVSGGTTSQVRVAPNSGSSLIQIDIDADAVADTEIELVGNDGVNIDPTDFNAV